MRRSASIEGLFPNTRTNRVLVSRTRRLQLEPDQSCSQADQREGRYYVPSVGSMLHKNRPPNTRWLLLKKFQNEIKLIGSASITDSNPLCKSRRAEMSGLGESIRREPIVFSHKTCYSRYHVQQPKIQPRDRVIDSHETATFAHATHETRTGKQRSALSLEHSVVHLAVVS